MQLRLPNVARGWGSGCFWGRGICENSPRPSQDFFLGGSRAERNGLLRLAGHRDPGTATQAADSIQIQTARKFHPDLAERSPVFLGESPSFFTVLLLSQGSLAGGFPVSQPQRWAAAVPGWLRTARCWADLCVKEQTLRKLSCRPQQKVTEQACSKVWHSLKEDVAT